MGGREGRREEVESRGGVCSDGNRVNIYVCTSNEYNAMLWRVGTPPVANVDIRVSVCTYVRILMSFALYYVCTLHCSHAHPSTPHSPQLLDGNPLQVLVLQDVQQHIGPVAAVAEFAEV